MKIQISNLTHITETSPAVLREIRRRLTFENPAFLENQKHGYSTWNVPDEIRCYRNTGFELEIPRGFTGQALRIGMKHVESIHIDDRRRVLQEVSFQFTGNLKDFQVEAVKAVLQKPFGALQSPTGSGKTVMALAVIAERKQPSLIVCHTKELLNQWIDRIESFLGIPKAEVGIIGNGKMRIGIRVTVALVQSLVKHTEDVFEHIGFLIVDECHRCPSKIFLDVVTAFDCKFMLGLSATPWRRDGLTRLIWFYLGDRLHQVDAGKLVDLGHICRAEVITVETGFMTLIDGSLEYSRMLSELTQDRERNCLVARIAAHEVQTCRGITLVLSDRKEHCETLAMLLADHGVKADVLTGDLSSGKRTALVDRLRAGDVRILVATGQLIGEGVDLPTIESLLLVTPLKFSGRLIQYIGRALRPSPGKDCARIIDFCDPRVSVLAAGARSRLRTFMGMPGVTIAG
jgi:superfamily II DNA or RNA helicase